MIRNNSFSNQEQIEIKPDIVNIEDEIDVHLPNFLTENELDLFLKSLDEIWTTELYSKLKQNGLIRHVI